MTAPAPVPAATPLRSALYECTVLHERFAPRRHAFSYRLFYLALDLDEIPVLARRLKLLSLRLGGRRVRGRPRPRLRSWP